MFLTKLAIKNLVRHRNRSIFTSIIIAMAILIYIFLIPLLEACQNYPMKQLLIMKVLIYR